MTVGEKIKQLLKKTGLSAEYLASELGVTATTVFSMYKRDSIESKHIEKMVNIFDVPLDYFFDLGNAPIPTISGNDNLTNTLSNVRVGGDLKNVGNSKKNNGIGSDCEHLERLLAEKDLRLEEKERFIKMQQELIESLKKK